MTEQDDELTILISPAEGGYTAAAPGPNGVATGRTMAEALAAAVEAIGPLPEDGLRVKVREKTGVSAEALTDLLVGLWHALEASRLPAWEIIASERLDLSGCNLEGIDLSPEVAALDALAVPDALLRHPKTRGIILCGAQLEGARLWNAQLQGADLSAAQLQGAYLEGARLQGACLDLAQLQGARLWGAQLQGARLWGAQLQGASLSGAQLQGADLRGAHLSDILWRAQLQGADLLRAQLEGASLHDAQFQGADLRGADLRELDLREVASLDQVRWHNAKLEKTWLYRRQIEPVGDEIAALTGKDPVRYREAMETYFVLKTNFQSLGNYEDASWAYVKEQQMEKMALYWEWRSGGWVPWRKWRSVLRWLRNWAYELLSGYGERPQMPVLWGLVTVAAFFGLYWGAGNISPGGWLNALTHSIAAFATVGFSTLEPVGWGARMLTAVEAMLGIGFFALFVYTLGNRMSRS